MSINIQSYTLEHDDYSAIEISGFDTSVFYGTGLASKGIKAYIRVGFTAKHVNLKMSKKISLVFSSAEHSAIAGTKYL
ncbi:MAG: hypothetical protein HRT53_15105 [Colwellia sp.]|nr:hypothetical protein [Colwellia sp.]